MNVGIQYYDFWLWSDSARPLGNPRCKFMGEGTV